MCMGNKTATIAVHRLVSAIKVSALNLALPRPDIRRSFAAFFSCTTNHHWFQWPRNIARCSGRPFPHEARGTLSAAGYTSLPLGSQYTLPSRNTPDTESGKVAMQKEHRTE